MIASSSAGAAYPAIASWMTLFIVIERIDNRLAASDPGPAVVTRFRKLSSDLLAQGAKLLRLIPANDPGFEAGTGVSRATFAACVRKLDYDLKADGLKLSDRKAAAILRKALGR